MDKAWLLERDQSFFKDRYREYCGQLVLCHQHGLTAFVPLVRAKMELLLSTGKLSKADALTIEVDVRASQAEVEEIWKQHLAQLEPTAHA